MFSLYELAYRIKEIPGGIIGKPAITRLDWMLNGYKFGLKQAGIAEDKDDFDFREFREWVQNYYECNLPTGWSDIILFYKGNDEERAFWKFFDLLEEFKRRANPLETDRGYDWGDQDEDEDEDNEAKKASLASSRPA